MRKDRDNYWKRNFKTNYRVECSVPVHRTSSRPLATKKLPCVRSRSVRTLYCKIKRKKYRNIAENEGKKLLTIQKKLQFVENFWPLKQLFTLNKLWLFNFFLSLFCCVFSQQCCGTFFSINFKPWYRFLTPLDLTQEVFKWQVDGYWHEVNCYTTMSLAFYWQDTLFRRIFRLDTKLTPIACRLIDAELIEFFPMIPSYF